MYLEVDFATGIDTTTEERGRGRRRSLPGSPLVPAHAEGRTHVDREQELSAVPIGKELPTLKGTPLPGNGKGTSGKSL